MKEHSIVLFILLIIFIIFIGFFYSNEVSPIESKRNIRKVLNAVYNYENEYDKFMEKNELSEYATKDMISFLEEHYPTRDYSNVNDKVRVSDDISLLEITYVGDTYVKYNVKKYIDGDYTVKSYIASYEYSMFGKIKSFKECEIESENLKRWYGEEGKMVGSLIEFAYFMTLTSFFILVLCFLIVTIFEHFNRRMMKKPRSMVSRSNRLTHYSVKLKERK